MVKLVLIYLRDGRMILAREPLADWRALQERYDGYMTSLAFDTIDEVREFLVLEYRITEERALAITTGWESGDVEIEV